MNGRTLLIVALFASLALNVFVVGAFVGARLNAEAPRRDGGEPGRRNPVAHAVRTLPPEARAAWRERMQPFVKENGPRIREARRLARETMGGFGAEPFDAEATLAELRRARALEHESRVEMDEQLVAFAATLSPEERARFGEALARPPESGRGGAGGRHRPGLPDR